MEVSSGRHMEKTIHTTRVESTMSFLQIRASTSLQEKVLTSLARNIPEQQEDSICPT
jgi:hypothetical protein